MLTSLGLRHSCSLESLPSLTVEYSASNTRLAPCCGYTCILSFHSTSLRPFPTPPSERDDGPTDFRKPWRPRICDNTWLRDDLWWWLLDVFCWSLEPLVALDEIGAQRRWSLVSRILSRDEVEVDVALTSLGLRVLRGTERWPREREVDAFGVTWWARGPAWWHSSGLDTSDR